MNLWRRKFWTVQALMLCIYLVVETQVVPAQVLKDDQLADSSRQVEALQTLDTLIAALKGDDLLARINAATALGHTRDSRAVEPLLKALQDPNYQVRFRSAEALGEIGDRRATHGLIAVLHNPDQSTRLTAVRALGELKDPRAVDALTGMLNDPLPNVRVETVRSIGEIGDARSIKPLIEVLNDCQLDQAIEIGDAFGKIGRPAVLPLLTVLEGANVVAREGAARALGDIDDPRAATALRTAFKAHDSLVIAGAHRLFMKQSDEATQDALVQTLKQFGDVAMADDFMNSGKARLEKAGEGWGIGKGYMIGGNGNGQKFLFVP